VIRGFNLTLRKFQNIIQRLRLAEDVARAEASKTEQAYLELQSAQEAIVQSEKLASLGGLVAGIAHEINTPVGVTLTSASVLLEETKMFSQAMSSQTITQADLLAYLDLATECSHLILKNSERAAHLIHSFKQVSADQTSEQRRKFELNEYLDEIITSLQAKLRQKHVKVKLTGAEAIMVDGFPGAVAQVITNLTMNTLAHAFVDSENCEIEINTKCEDGMVCILFSDNGCGEFLRKYQIKF